MNTTAPETVELSPYSPMWPAVFDIEKGRLLDIFQADPVVIEHVGSTAVPGLGAKPIIDILLGAPSMAMVEARIPALVASGYRYVREFEAAFPERRFFDKKDGQPGRFHLHAVVLGTSFWRDHLEFRDRLRADAGLAERYWRLKTIKAARFRNDRSSYTDAKGEFIRHALSKPQP